MGNIAKMLYTQSVGDNNVLSLMLQMKQVGTLKKGDKISIPAGLHTLDDGVTTDVNDIHFLPMDGTDNGMMIHEIITTAQDSTMGPKGKSFCTKLTNIEASNPKGIEEAWGTKIGDEYLVFVAEAINDKIVLVLNDNMEVPVTKPVDGEKEPRAIGREHLSMFSDTRRVSDEDGKESSRESVRKLREIRKSVSFLRKTEAVRHSEVVVQEGGLKVDHCYLTRLETASRDYIDRGADSVDTKWKGINLFKGASGLPILRNKEAFRNFAVLGKWDGIKHSRLTNMFLSVDETPNDDSQAQLISISRNMSTVLQIAHGLHWNPVLIRFIEKVERGDVGNLCTAHTKRLMDETWEACSHDLGEDDNLVSLSIDGATKTYRMDVEKDVVEMISDRFNAIKETDFASKERYLKSLQSDLEKPSSKPVSSSTQNSGKKHELFDGKTDGHVNSKKKGRENDEDTAPTTEATGKHRTVELGSKTREKPVTSRERLCIFDLKHQLLRDQPECTSGDSCDRHHYRKSLRESDGYYWTLKTVTDEVNATRPFILSEMGKTKLLEAVKMAFKHA